MNRKNKYSLLLIVIAFLLSSCRMDITEIEEINAEKNFPDQQTSLNFASFVVNAENYTTSANINLDFNTNRSSLFISSFAHTSGKAILIIKSFDQITFYETEIRSNLTSYVRTLTTNQPGKIVIQLRDFTGKLRIQLSALDD